MTNLDIFFTQYLVTALWSSIGDDESPLDATHHTSDIAPETIRDMQEDCKKFIAENAVALHKAGDDGQNAHDFWLTRNGHGVGFWDRGYDKDVSDKLCESCNSFGELSLYIGDDGKIYC